MADKKSFGLWWEEYRPSKTVMFWSCAAVSVLTVVIGFNWGGWVTGGTAQEMVQDGRRNLAATFCVQRFLAAPDATAQHASLLEAGSWKRDDFVTKGGWDKLPELDQPVAGVADLCADKLADIEVSATAAEATAEATGETGGETAGDTIVQ